MKTSSVFKIQSVVAIALVSLFTNQALSSADDDAHCRSLGLYPSTLTTVNGATSPTCAPLPLNAKAQSCKDAVTAYSGLARPANFSETKLATFRKCQGQDAALGEDSEEDAALDAEANDSGKCSKYLDSGCPQLNSASAAEAQTALTAAQKEYNDTQKEYLDQKKTYEQSVKNLKRAIEDGVTNQKTMDSNYNSAQLDLQNNKINNDLKLTQAQRDQFIKTAQQIATLEAAYTDLDTQLELTKSSVSQAQTAHEATCRGVAEKQMQEAKKLVEMTVQQRKTERYNYALATLAGSATRRMDKDNAKIQLAYVNSYKDCLAGADGAGANAMKAIKDMQDLADKKAIETTKRKADVQKQIDLAKAAMAAMEKTFSEQGDASAREAAATALKLSDKYRRDSEANAKAVSRAQQDLGDLQQQGPQSLAIAQQSQKLAEGMLATSKDRNSCLSSHTKGSSSASEHFRDQGEASISYDDQRMSFCGSIKDACTSVDENVVQHARVIGTCDGKLGTLIRSGANSGK